jgi:hypothetical protein
LGDRVSEKWWLIADCDAGIGSYYRDLFFLHTHKCEKLQPPAWKEHITIIRNEEPPEANKVLWEKYANKPVEFAYSAVPDTDGLFVWLHVECSLFESLREELGLSPKPTIPFHLTIGNFKNG